ncbi:MAG: hypothetical protein JW838_14095 [Spirochaetes bacterium]|nr:hypothetical protein [Spirochaetota bacterium]
MKTELLVRHPPAKRLYGKSLIRNRFAELMKRILVCSILAFPVMAAGVNMTCLRQSRAAADPRWNDVARYLAGLEPGAGSPLSARTADPRFREHARFMDDLWEKIEEGTVVKIRAWRDDTLLREKISTAIYPLSGADFINLYSLYPKASRYLMIALEPPGDATQLLDCESERLIQGLAPLRRGIYLYGVNNYFQSKVMYREMNNALLPGTAPVLLIFMARLGLTVTGVENVTLAPSGRLASRAVQHTGEENEEIQGVRIRFTGKGFRRSGELIYLSMRLRGDSADPSTPEGKFLRSMKGAGTLLKSAVYLLQDDRYGAFRDFLLSRSRLIVQDDSGIAYGAFGSKWEIDLYGTYRPAYGLKGCYVRYQRDLDEAYRKESRPLPFKFGYGILVGPNQSNLMIARKKG